MNETTKQHPKLASKDLKLEENIIREGYKHYRLPMPNSQAQ